MDQQEEDLEDQLFEAITDRNIKLVEYLLDQPALDIRSIWDDGETALCIACEDKSIPLEIIALIIKKKIQAW